MPSDSKEAALTRSEERFETAQKASRKAREVAAQDILEKTTRLRALRLAKDAAELAAAEKTSDIVAKPVL
jgi:hypothetical protein